MTGTQYGPPTAGGHPIGPSVPWEGPGRRHWGAWEALSSDAKGCRVSWCRVSSVTTPGKGHVSPLCQNYAVPKATPRRSPMSCVIQKGRVSPLCTGPPPQGGNPRQPSSSPTRHGKAERPQGSSPPDVQPAFLCGDSAERQPKAQMGRINLGAGSLGPRCSVFSRLVALGSRCGSGLGAGHSSRCMQSEQERGRAQLRRPGHRGLGLWGLGQGASTLALPSTRNPRAKRGSGFTHTQKNSDSGAAEPKGSCLIV